MFAPAVLLGVALLVATKPASETAADSVTLRDGKVILGQIVDPAPRGGLSVIVRRAWVAANQPELLKHWESDEKPLLLKATKQRRERLAGWRRDRAASAGPDDRVLVWIEQELARLGGDAGEAEAPLMVVTISRGSVKSIACAGPAPRAACFAWAGARGYRIPKRFRWRLSRAAWRDAGSTFRVASRWDSMTCCRFRSRPTAYGSSGGAATEVTHDNGLKFLRVGPIILPEPAPGAPAGPGLAAAALPDLTKLLDGKMTDPLPERLGEVAARGRVGARRHAAGDEPRPRRDQGRDHLLGTRARGPLVAVRGPLGDRPHGGGE